MAVPVATLGSSTLVDERGLREGVLHARADLLDTGFRAPLGA